MVACVNRVLFMGLGRGCTERVVGRVLRHRAFGGALTRGARCWCVAGKAARVARFLAPWLLWVFCRLAGEQRSELRSTERLCGGASCALRKGCAAERAARYDGAGLAGKYLRRASGLVEQSLLCWGFPRAGEVFRALAEGQRSELRSCVLKWALIRQTSPEIPGGSGDAVSALKPWSLPSRLRTPEPFHRLKLERYLRPASA